MEENEANLTEYELERKRKIARNQALIAQLDLKSLASKVAPPEKPKRVIDATGNGENANKRGPKGAHARKRMKPQRFSSRADKLKKQQRLTSWKGQRIGSLRARLLDGRVGANTNVVTTEVIALGRLDAKEKESDTVAVEDGGGENGTPRASSTPTVAKNDGGAHKESMQTSDFLAIKYNMSMGKSHLKNVPQQKKRGRPRLDEMEWGVEQKPPAYVMAENALIPRRYLAEGEYFDEPYSAWVDEHQKHHLIWGKDDASKSQKSVQTVEEGVDTPSEAAVLILEELQRREFEKWESEREENLKTAIAQKIAVREDMLTEAYYPYGRDALPSRYKNMKPINWYQQQQQQQQRNASQMNTKKISAIFADPTSEEARKMRLRQELEKSETTTKINPSARDYGGVLQCSTCSKSYKDTPKMRAGQFEGMDHLCTACGLFYATFGRKRPMEMKEFEELPINVQKEKHAAFVKLEEEARLKAIEKSKQEAAENAPPPESATAAAPASANEDAKPKLVFTMKSPSAGGEGENARTQPLSSDTGNINSISTNGIAEGIQKKEVKAELGVTTKVAEGDAPKVVVGGEEQRQPQQQRINETTDVKDTATAVTEATKPSLKIVMHRSHAAPDGTKEGGEKEGGGGEDSGATAVEVKREADGKVEETKTQEVKTTVVTGNWISAKLIGLNHCRRLEFAEHVQKAIPKMGEMTKLLTLVGAGLMTKDMVEEGVLPDKDAISQMQPWIAQLNPTKLPARYLVNAKFQILPPAWSNPDVGSDALMFAANIVHTTPLMINPTKLRKYEPKDIDGDMLFGYGQYHVQDSLIAFRDRDEEWQTPVPASNENNNEMDEDVQDELDAMRDYKETLERESLYEEECDRTLYIQGVNKAISSIQKVRLKESRDTERIKERNRRAKEQESEKKRLRMQMALQPVRFMTPREREKYLHEKQRKMDAKNGKIPSDESGKPLLKVTMKNPAARPVKGRAYTPKEIPIICGKLTGVLLTNGRPRVDLKCRIDCSGEQVGVTEFERKGGSKSKKWKNSIKMRLDDEIDDSTGITLGHHLINSGKELDNNGEIINKKVAVYRSSDDGFHIGTITKFLESSGEHRVEYENGKPEELYLFLMDLKWEPEVLDEEANAAEEAKEQAKLKEEEDEKKKEEEEEEQKKKEEEKKEEEEEEEEEEEDFENLSDLELVQKIGKPAGAPGISGAKYPISIGPFEVYTIDDIGVSKHNPMRMSERRKCLEILKIVRGAEGKGKGGANASKRFLTEMFEHLPQKSHLPEYYKIIRYPIDIATIEFSLKSGVYASPWWFFVALELAFANAQRYNDPATQMYADAAALRECMHRAGKELFGSDVPFPTAGGDIYDDVEEPREYRETRIVPYEINDEENPFAGDDVVYRDHREIISDTSGLYHPPAQISPKVIREEIEREKAAIEEYGYEAAHEQENEQPAGGGVRGRTKIRYENKPMEIPSLKIGKYKKRRRSKGDTNDASSEEEEYDSAASDSDFTGRKKKSIGNATTAGGKKRGRPFGTRKNGTNDTTIVAISLLERYSQLGTNDFMEKIEARGGGSGKEWARGGRKTAAFTAYMRNKSDIFTEVTSAGGGIWTLAKGISADKAREKLEPRHLPSRAARRQRSSGAEGDDDDDDDYDEEEEEDYGREAKVSKNATIAHTNADGGSAWEWKNTDGTMTQKATTACHSVLRAIRSAVEPETKRLRSELFEVLPTQKVLPEYYKAIANPIDLRSITKCLRENGYPTIWSFLLAIELCFSNAQSFNEEDSQIYEDAEEMRKVGNDALRQLVPGHPVPVRDSCYDMASAIEPPWEKVKPKLTFTMKQKDQDVAKALHALQPSGKCGKCSVCAIKKSPSKSKGAAAAAEKCITNRMLQVAHDTNLDLALLAAKGQNAVGVKLEIFWPGEDTWYSAVIKSFDESTCEHVCEYVDDDVEEKLALWDDSNWEEGTKLRIP